MSCEVVGCERPGRSTTARWCELHRGRMRRTGTVEFRPRVLVPLEDRFWAKVDRRGKDECWRWIGAIDTTGYGRIGRGRREDGIAHAHRLSYEINVGPIPPQMTIDHLCVHPWCVNPNHLEVVTHAENCRRAKRRWTHCPRGHEFDEANTYWRPQGRRMCRACAQLRRAA